ncbi:hypothetical protein BD779DRAFT_1564838 [Infundibulicybe gibba]|nr:hypothetical protein BD779DRAFT_1564838 [Infundibulicybe gibba]
MAPFDPAHRLVTSPFFSPLALAAIRLSIALYTLVTLLFTLIWDGIRLKVAAGFFSYFTHLSYIGVCAYFFASGTQTLSYALHTSHSSTGYPLQRWPRILQYLHTVLYSSVVTFAPLVTVVFWALLSSPDTFATTFDTWDNISVHALNTVFTLFELLGTNAPPLPWLHIMPCELMLAGYLGVAYITHATQGFYTYTFLDPKRQHALLAAYIVGIAVGEIIVFAAAHGLSVLRIHVTRRSAGAHGAVGVQEALDEWEEVDVPREGKPGV